MIADLEEQPLFENESQIHINSPSATQTQPILMNQGFISLRKYKSLFEADKRVYYFQTVEYLKELKKTFYIMIPEDR